MVIIQEILFPIMQYSDADQELWDTDPIEYIRTKFGKRLYTSQIENPTIFFLAIVVKYIKFSLK